MGINKIGANRIWTRAELDYLSDNYGLMPDRALARQLDRPVNGIVIAAKRHLRINRKANFYTARNVADLLGISCSKAVVWWIRKGWLQGCRSSVSCGGGRMWKFTEDQAVSCLRKRPWLVDLDRMQPGYFRSVVREEWEADPWYTLAEVGELLGLAVCGGKCEGVTRYIANGWLKAEKRPGGPWQGQWIFRRSAVEDFLRNDPRPEHRRAATSAARRRVLLDRGDAARDAVVWSIICPACREMVRVCAPPKMAGPKVRDAFASTFTGNGHCDHGAFIDMEGAYESWSACITRTS